MIDLLYTHTARTEATTFVPVAAARRHGLGMTFRQVGAPVLAARCAR